MPKQKADYGSMLDLPDDPVEAHTAVRSNSHINAQSDNRTPVQKRASPKRRGAVKGRKEETAEDDGRIQRSLYAKEETFKRIRRYAFDNDRPAQELYREALYLLMRKHKLDEGISSPDDV